MRGPRRRALVVPPGASHRVGPASPSESPITLDTQRRGVFSWAEEHMSSPSWEERGGGGAAAPAAQKASPAHRNTENTNFDPQASVGSCARGRRGACRERAIGASTGLCCRMRQAAPLVDRHLAPHMLWGPPARSTSGGCIGVPESGEQGRVTGLRRRPAPPAPMCAGRPVFQVSRQSDGSAQRSQSRSPHRRRRCKRRPSSTSES